MNTREKRLMKNPAYHSTASKTHEMLVTFVIVSGDIYWLIVIGGCAGLVISIAALGSLIMQNAARVGLAILGVMVWMYLTNLAGRFARSRQAPVTQLMPKADGITRIIQGALTCGLCLVCLSVLLLIKPIPRAADQLLVDFACLFGYVAMAIIVSWALKQMPWSEQRPRAFQLILVSLMCLAVLMAWMNITLQVGWSVVLIGTTLMISMGILWPTQIKMGSQNTIKQPTSGTMRKPMPLVLPEIFQPPITGGSKAIAIQALRRTAYGYLNIIPIFLLIPAVVSIQMSHFKSDGIFMLACIIPVLICLPSFVGDLNRQPWLWTALLPVDRQRLAREHTLFTTWLAIHAWILSVACIAPLMAWKLGLDHRLVAFSPGVVFLLTVIARVESTIDSSHLRLERSSASITPLVTYAIGFVGLLFEGRFRTPISDYPVLTALVNIGCIAVAGLCLRLHWALWMTHTSTMKGPEFDVYKALLVFFKGSGMKQAAMNLPGASI